ncbi:MULTISPECIES: hypothetical protein [Microbacterium]|nr:MULTISPECIES: hypothetical protein [Microbacterium]QEA27709.1 hypothetical protein FGL91_03510 [Microbacterium sp. CBA3102]
MQFAFTDKSEPPGTGSDGPYLMAATLPLGSEAAQLDDLRDIAGGDEASGRFQLHRYDDIGSLKDDTVATMSARPALHGGVVCPAAGSRPERTRRICMERILWALDRRDAVTHVVFESRGCGG